MKKFGGLFALAIVVLMVPAAEAADLRFSAVMTGAQEVPGVDTDGSGRAFIRIDEGGTRLNLFLRFRGLMADPVAMHFHCNQAGANGPVALDIVGPLEIDGDRVVGVLTNDDFREADACIDAVGRPINNLASLAQAMEEGLIYVNVHTPASPPGEIRGQVRVQPAN